MSNESIDVVFNFVQAYIAQHHYPPTLREIAAACFIHPATAMRYLDKLEVQRRIVRESGKSRSIIILQQPPASDE